MSATTTKHGPGKRDLEAVADALGHDLRDHRVHSAKAVEFPSGLRLPLKMQFSHAVTGQDYYVACYQVVGNIYLAVAHEQESNVTTLLLLDKTPFVEQHGKYTYLATFVQDSERKGKAETLDDYVLLVQPMIKGAWFRKGHGSWKPLDIAELLPPQSE